MNKLYNQDLFRRQALDAQFFKQHGNIKILPSQTHSVGLFLLLLWTCAGGYFVSTQVIADSLKVRGWIDTTSPTLDIHNQSGAGVVNQIYVKNGQSVSEGQRLALIVRAEGEGLGQLGRREWLDAIQHEYDTQVNILTIEKSRLGNKLAILKAELHSVITQQEALAHHQEQQKSLDKDLSTRLGLLKKLQQEGSISPQQIDQQHIQILSLKQSSLDTYLQAQQLEGRQQQIATQIELLLADKAEIENKKRLTLLASDAKKRQARQSNEFLISAPRAAQVDNLLISEGEYVAFGQALMQLSPQQTEHIVYLVLSAAQISNVKLHQSVNVSIDGYAYQQFGFIEGRIVHISNKVLLAEHIAKAPIPINQAVYLVKLELDTSNKRLADIKLRSGMTVQASIYAQEQTILAWFFAPLIRSIKQSFQNHSPQGTRT